MPAIRLTAFTGEQPRVIARLMPDTAAQSAINTRLDDGGLTPMRQSAFTDTAGAATWKTIYNHQGTWLGWDTVVNAAPGPVADDRLYYTGDGKPKLRVGGAIYDLAVPRPASALTATLSGTGAGDIVTRVYAYTFVSDFGEESEPCDLSASVDWKPGQTVTLSGFTAAPAGRAITKQRIYRSQTGQSGTYLYLLTERAASASDFTDNIAVDAFQEPLPSANWNTPPDGLTGLIALPNGMMAAFTGRDLYFCEPWRPHAWPQKYVLTMDSDIVGLGAMGTSLVVLTKRQPYMVSGTAPDSMQMEKVEQNLPCINARGIVDLGYAIAYPSNEGLVVARADGSFSMATGNIFNRDDWLELNPKTMVGGQLSGRYVSFYQTSGAHGETVKGALIIDLAGQSFLIRTDTNARAVFYQTESSSLFFLEDGTTSIRQIDAPNAARLNQYWRSKQFVLPYPENFGAILVDVTGAVDIKDDDALSAKIAAIVAANAALIAAGSIGGDIDALPLNSVPMAGDSLTPIPYPTSNTVAVGVYADGKLIASIAHVNRAVRLPAGFLARTWEVDVFGNVPVEAIAIAKSIDELKATA